MTMPEGGKMPQKMENRKRLWKGKNPKYLLITLGFPHSPQVFPQGFSTLKTGVKIEWYFITVDIIIVAVFRQSSIFWVQFILTSGYLGGIKKSLDKDFDKKSKIFKKRD